MIIAQMISTVSNLPKDASALQSSISALEIEIAKLDKSSSGLEWWLAGFTLAVLVGVALEIFVVSHDHTKEMEEWHLCDLIPNKPSLKKLRLEVASVILVVLGIFGELAIGLWISHIAGQLREKNGLLRSDSDQLLALVTQEAGNASTSADAAQDSADAVGEQYDDLLGKFRASEQELIELKAKSMPRRLSSAQKDILRKRVATFAIKTLDVWCINSLQEGFDFEQDFVDAFLHPTEVLPLQYLTSCNQIMGSLGGGRIFPLQVSVGADRQQDGKTLIDALVEIGIKRKDITRTSDDNRARLSLGIGPQNP